MDRRQKKLEKHRKERARLKKLASRPRDGASSGAALVRTAVRCPMGPAYVSADWKQGDAEEGVAPCLVSVLVTRQLPDGRVLGAMALVDRTCLGVKNGCVTRPVTLAGLNTMVAQMGAAHEGGMVPCEPIVAQSVVFHAIDYAARLGFAPHLDFPAELFGPRPSTLVETPFATCAQPYFASGPRDNVAAVMAKLDAAVGYGNYTYLIGVSE